MDKGQAIVVDIDNTILNNNRRKQEILSRRFNKKVGLDEISKDYNLSHILLNEKDRQEFWKIFFSNEFLEFDEPIQYAAKALSELAENYDIVYVTGRHDDQSTGDSMKEGTLASMRRYGFPVEGTEIHFKDKRETPDASFKDTKIRSLVAQREITFGVGDSPDDIKLYSAFNIRPIAIRTGYFKDKQFHCPGIQALILSNWIDVKYSILFLNSEEPDKLVEHFADEYRSFPSNLDNITGLVLLVNAFALGFVLNKFAGAVRFSEYLTLAASDLTRQVFLWFFSLSVIFLALSMIFSIFAFIPRSILFPYVGKPIMLIRYPKNMRPQAIANRIADLSADEKKAEFLKLVLYWYKSVEPKSVLIQRIFDLRRMQYRKIKWINYGAVSLSIGIASMIPLLFLAN